MAFRNRGRIEDIIIIILSPKRARANISRPPFCLMHDFEIFGQTKKPTINSQKTIKIHAIKFINF